MSSRTSFSVLAILLAVWPVETRASADPRLPLPIRIGAVFPLRGAMSPLARDEFRGVMIARDVVNAEGGVRGRPVVLDVRELDQPDQARSVMRSLRRDGIETVMGAYSSALSIPASTAAARLGMVYWEAGAVADRLTGRGLPTVFRVGANGSDLGRNGARFAAVQVARRLHRSPTSMRVSVVNARDAYAVSVANAAIHEARLRGMHVVSRSQYDVYEPDWPAVVQQVKQSHPNVLILASHIPDGVAFRRAMLAARVHVDAFIGSTMAQCKPEFGALLGRDAIGVFASDRPPAGFNPSALKAPARAVYGRLAAAWRRQTGELAPSEEGLSGFTAAWALFHYVLPAAARAGGTSPGRVSAAARALDLPSGTLPNGAGIRFGAGAGQRGQNLRAAAVIWQWQGVRHSVVVWPAVYATGTIKLVPLPR